MLEMLTTFNNIWEEMKNNDQLTNQCILCTLIDSVAAQSGKLGYEMIEEMLPILTEVGSELGVAQI